MAAASVFRDGTQGTEADGVVFRWETGSRFEADWACGFTSFSFLNRTEFKNGQQYGGCAATSSRMEAYFFVL
jgi:hypothetical protein